MIFQTSVKLNIDQQEIHAIFDMDTGMIGFTEISNGSRTEYSYQSAPPDFKMAFVELMLGLSGQTQQSNLLICRKGKAAQALQEFWQNSNES